MFWKVITIICALVLGFGLHWMLINHPDFAKETTNKAWVFSIPFGVMSLIMGWVYTSVEKVDDPELFYRLGFKHLAEEILLVKKQLVRRVVTFIGLFIIMLAIGGMAKYYPNYLIPVRNIVFPGFLFYFIYQLFSFTTIISNTNSFKHRIAILKIKEEKRQALIDEMRKDKKETPLLSDDHLQKYRQLVEVST